MPEITLSDDRREGRTALLAIVVLALVFGLLVADLVGDALQGVGIAHLAIEGAAAALAAAGIALLATRIRLLDREHRELQSRFREIQEAAERWQQEAGDLVGALRQAIMEQLERWQLSPAEREVALLLLQGLSHKQIAARRGASERTVRQQAHQLYRKVGISGRAELAAYFLAGLLPGNPRGTKA